jgi:hypothetical protein
MADDEINDPEIDPVPPIVCIVCGNTIDTTSGDGIIYRTMPDGSQQGPFCTFCYPLQEFP